MPLICGILKTKKAQTQSHRYSKQNGGCQRWEVRGVMKWLKGVKRYRFPVIRFSPGYAMSDMATIVNNTALSIQK